MPDVVKIAEMEEPWIEATILTPDEYLGSVLKLCQDRRGSQKELTYVGSRAMVKYDLPLNEVVFDFYDRLKSVSKGYASFDYHLTDYKPADLVKMQILVNNEPVDALSMLVHRQRAERPRPRHGREDDGYSAAHVRSRSRPRSAARSSPAKPSARCARTSPRSASAATSRESANFWRSRRKARRRCASSGRWHPQEERSSPR